MARVVMSKKSGRGVADAVTRSRPSLSYVSHPPKTKPAIKPHEDPRIELERLNQDRCSYAILAGLLLVINSMVMRGHLIPAFQQKRLEQTAAMLTRLQERSPGVPNYIMPVAATPMWASWASLSFCLSLLLAMSCLFVFVKAPPRPRLDEPKPTIDKYIQDAHAILDMCFPWLVIAVFLFMLGMIACLAQPSNYAWNILLWAIHLQFGWLVVHSLLKAGGVAAVLRIVAPPARS
ncbi:hypothetical protein BDN72DRAFT_955884 [Pluteus cervinus]|uniref:Uncharacterized protein n=1 Tax=Pluteus cervinus TaxID=181527 RepID=A0ACD3B8L3_9AGAR|nr:hypothetical protein BDN72DRAFT_955884 [Pluteus cervinus]